jgi:hypothetical protein
MNPNIAAILGALIGDSATLGLHWIYDPKRISEIEKLKGLVYLQPDASHYDGIKAILHMVERLLENQQVMEKYVC